MIIKNLDLITKIKKDFIRDGYDRMANKSIHCIRPRSPDRIVFIHGGWNDLEVNNTIECYDWQTNMWFETTSSELVGRSYHGIEVIIFYNRMKL